MVLIIRPFTPADAEAVEAILQASWRDDPTMQATYRWHRAWPEENLIRHTLVAEVAERVIGAGTLFESTIHPRMLFVNINIASKWQRQGIGAALYDALHGQWPHASFCAIIQPR